jgi:hypothetical protein
VAIAALCLGLGLAGCSSAGSSTPDTLPPTKGKPSEAEFCALVGQYEASSEQDLVNSNDLTKLRKGANELAPVVARMALVAPKAIHADMATVATAWAAFTKQAAAASSVKAFEAAAAPELATSNRASRAVGTWALKNC